MNSCPQKDENMDLLSDKQNKTCSDVIPINLPASKLWYVNNSIRTNIDV